MKSVSEVTGAQERERVREKEGQKERDFSSGVGASEASVNRI